LVAEARVRRIRLAQDVINSAEENVYDTLWNAKLLQTDDREACRIVQAGYDYLVRRTRLARKTIQRIIAKLLEKDFIAVETRADIYLRTATVYRVFSYKAVLDKHMKKGRLYVAKMGPGFSYASPLEGGASSSEHEADMTTVVTSNMSTGVKTDMSTMVKETTVTVVKIDQPTVVKMSPYLLDTDVLDKSSSSSIRQELSIHGLADDDVVHQLITRCREQAPDCTEQEILHFIREKSMLIQKKKGSIYNPLGFLVTAVPRCFAPDTLRAHRQEMARRHEGEALGEVREQAAMERWRREQETMLSDPNVSEQEKHLIRLCLGLNTN
jgi:predicted transcriptional regulator